MQQKPYVSIVERINSVVSVMFTRLSLFTSPHLPIDSPLSSFPFPPSPHPLPTLPTLPRSVDPVTPPTLATKHQSIEEPSPYRARLTDYSYSMSSYS